MRETEFRAAVAVVLSKHATPAARRLAAEVIAGTPAVVLKFNRVAELEDALRQCAAAAEVGDVHGVARIVRRAVGKPKS